MVIHGRVKNGVVVFEGNAELPEGTRVFIVAETGAEPTVRKAAQDRLSEYDHRRKLKLIETIAALPIEGSREPFSGANHDRVLYGEP
jgi:hypothetical protein